MDLKHSSCTSCELARTEERFRIIEMIIEVKKFIGDQEAKEYINQLINKIKGDNCEEVH